MSIANFGIENHTHECQQCGMKFYNSQELVNHIRKFCSGAGLNSLEGLAQYQLSNNMSKKLKSYGAQSLGSMKYEPVYNSSQLAKQAKNVAIHKQQLSVNRPYSNTNANQKAGPEEYKNNNKTDLGVYERSIVQNVNIPQNQNKRAVYGERVLANSEVSIKSLGNFGVQNNHRNIKTSNANNEYFSPPSQVPFIFAKNRGPTVLDKSNSSIANMGVSQKKQYANDKLVELDSIAEMYDKGGGMNMQFRKNLQKMRKFYKKMLEDDQPTKKYPGEFAISRVQTPISRLRDLTRDENIGIKQVTKQPKDALDQQVNKRSDRKTKQIKDKTSKIEGLGINQYMSMPNFSYPGNSMGYQNPYPLYPQGYPPFPQQPQIIMMPPYPQQSQTPAQTGQQIKYFQKLIEVKNEQNKRLMQMLLQSRKQKNATEMKSKVEQIRQSRISQIHNSRLIENNVYHMETPMQTMPSTEQKILLALQREELDELRLLSSLPEQLQQLKMDSVMKIIEQRTQLQKQILQQKVKRLEEQKNNQLYEEQVRLEKDEWANQERKKLIGYQMDDVLQQFKRKVAGEDSEQDEEEEEGADEEEVGQQ